MQVPFISIAIEDPVVTVGSLKEIKRNSLRDTVLQPSQRGMRKKKSIVIILDSVPKVYL